MNRIILTTAITLSLGLGLGAQAQTSPPVGGPSAKGNAPLKSPHTVNDGSAKPGANSFTEGQARQHILNSGYSDVSSLAKGNDGVWRGTAVHGGATVSVAMDFKGNVTEAAAAGPMSASSSPQTSMASPSARAPAADAMTAAAPSRGSTAMSKEHRSMHHHHVLRHHRHHSRCAHPGPNGVACSGVSTVRNGVSDREVHAIQSGAHP